MPCFSNRPGLGSNLSRTEHFEDDAVWVYFLPVRETRIDQLKQRTDVVCKGEDDYDCMMSVFMRW